MSFKALTNMRDFKKIFLYSASFILMFFVLFAVFSFVSTKISENAANGADLADIQTEASASSSVYFAVLSIFILLILTIILSIYSFSFFENLCWNTLEKTKTTFKSVNKFLLLTLMDLIIFTAVNWLVFLILSLLPETLLGVGAFLFYVCVALSMYFMSVSWFLFSKSNSIIKSMQKMFSVGFNLRKVYWFWIGAIVLTVVSELLYLAFTVFNETVQTVLEGLVFVAFVTWYRISLSNTLKSEKV